MPKNKKEIEQDIDKLYDHAEVANREMGVIKTDIAWIKKAMFMVASSSIGAFFTALANILK